MTTSAERRWWCHFFSTGCYGRNPEDFFSVSTSTLGLLPTRKTTAFGSSIANTQGLPGPKTPSIKFLVFWSLLASALIVHTWLPLSASASALAADFTVASESE